MITRNRMTIRNSDSKNLFYSFQVDENDNKPQNICINCNQTINQLQEIKNTWLDNQEKFNFKIEAIEEAHFEDKIFECSQAEDDLNETEEGAIEYSEEFAIEVADEETLDDEDFEETIETPNFLIEKLQNIKERQRKTKASADQSEKAVKGKEIYQKLLQQCPECSKMIEKNRMEGHMNKHNNIRPYTCNEDGCGKSFYCKLLLRLHRKSIHTGQNITCQVCLKTFPSERSLYSHNLRHKNENRYNCEHCDKKFNNVSILKH